MNQDKKQGDGTDFIRDLFKTGTGQVRTYLSTHHLGAARYFADQARLQEAQLKRFDPMSPPPDHRAYVIGAVVLSVAFLEAEANELYCDTELGDSPHHLKGLDVNVVRLMRRLWRRGIPRTARYSIMEKFLLIFDLAEKSFDKSTATYCNVDALIKLRNALVHSEPEWQPFDGRNSLTQEQTTAMERKLIGKFPETAETENSMPFYPNRCLSAGCAEWAVGSAHEFVKQVHQELGLSGRKVSTVAEYV